MFDFSFPELLIIGIVAVLVLDPRHLPDVARSAGRWMGRARRLMDKMRADLDDQIGEEHLAPLRELNQEWQRTKSLLHEQVPAEWLGDDASDALQPHPVTHAPPLPSAASPSPSRPRRRRRTGRKRARRPGTNQDKSTVRKPDGGGEGA
ncbi:MAG: twin-arginine translocase TatA/TatE family subunit [Gammaproteobacteria bacterium]|nr:twin-arginine translocase TatA/TatE family subunit [Gammaproteobacteria bacterium]